MGVAEEKEEEMEEDEVVEEEVVEEEVVEEEEKEEEEIEGREGSKVGRPNRTLPPSDLVSFTKVLL